LSEEDPLLVPFLVPLVAPCLWAPLLRFKYGLPKEI